MGERHRPPEQPAVKTTIVGGRPPGPGKAVGQVPRGIEVLVKKASVDADFRRLLLEKRAGAAKEIELTLEPAEAMMLDAVPTTQLEAIIASTTVAPVSRAAFLGKAAAAMLAALGAGACEEIVPVKGIAPDRPPVTKDEQPDRPPAKPKSQTPAAAPQPSSEQPAMPMAGAIPQPIPRTKTDGALPLTKGIQPDRP